MGWATDKKFEEEVFIKMEMTPEERLEDMENEKKIERFLKKVLKFLEEHKSIFINRDISGKFVRIEYGAIPRN